VTSFAAGVVMLIYRFVCVRENRKRDDSGVPEGYEHAYQDDLTDKSVSVGLGLSNSCFIDTFTNFISFRTHNSGIFYDLGSIHNIKDILKFEI
jgi:hypothetical protein